MREGAETRRGEGTVKGAEGKLCRSAAFPRDSFDRTVLFFKETLPSLPSFFFFYTSQMSRSANAHGGGNSAKSRLNAKYVTIVRRLAEAEYSTSAAAAAACLVSSDQRFLSLQLASLRASSLFSRLASSAEVQTNGDAAA